MNRTTFLFLVLLIGSCIVTVNSRHSARTLITEKAVLQEKVSSLTEAIRRLELEKARISAKVNEGPCVADSPGTTVAKALAHASDKAPTVSAKHSAD